MAQKLILISILFTQLFFAHTAYADEKVKKLNELYESPGYLDSFYYIPRNLKDSWGDVFNTKPATLWGWGAVITSSVVFYIYDEKIYAHARSLGRKLGIGNNDHTETILEIGGAPIFRGPTDVGSLMHFIGDGWAQAFTAIGFASYGTFNGDNRAKQTASQILNSLFTGSIPTQLMKRATGREIPIRTTEYRGKWKLFSKNYDKDISAHDAVPSGHMMAATSTLTVIDTNYPEYRHFMRPLSITLLTLLGFQMANIGVHWVSDYPIGIAIGYITAKNATRYGRKRPKDSKYHEPKITDLNSWEFIPTLKSVSRNERSYGLTGVFRF